METLKSCRINVMVADINASVDFYCNTLGLDLLNQYGEHYAEIQAPDLLIGLHPKSEKTQLGTNMSIGFGVGEFDAAVETLKAEGIEINVEDEGWVRLAYFKDLDGNSLYLAENKTP